MPNSTVVLAKTPQGYAATMTIPVSELEAALGHPVALSDRAPLEAYMRAHTAVLDAGGRSWAVTVERIDATGSDHPVLTITTRFAAPARGATAHMFRYDAVNHRIASLYALVYHLVGDKRVPLGRLQSPATTLVLP